jgi:hypothetical protein
MTASNLIAGWLPISSLILGVVLPLSRIALRFLRGIEPYYSSKNSVHDATAGLTLPFFCGLVLSLIWPDILLKMDRHVLAVAGMLGVIYTLSDLVGDVSEDTLMTPDGCNDRRGSVKIKGDFDNH